ncbi:hypothetical protein BH09PSE5_BH09PSE5_49300 [soil metagenome]
MANILLVGGEKGGVGKSVVARLLAQYMIDHEMPFIGFDTDRSHGSLLRFYANYASPVVIDNYGSMDKIIEAAVEVPERRVLVDLAAQTHAPLVKWMDESGVLDMADESGMSVRYWHVMDSGKDACDMLKRLLDRFGARLNYVVVLNQLRAETFEIFEQSGEKERAASLGAKIITIKRLHDTVIAKIDASSSSFWTATQTPDMAPSTLGMMERQRAKMWLKAAYAEIDKAGV